MILDTHYTPITTATLQTWDQFNYRIGIAYLKKEELELINSELKFATKILNLQINLPFNFLIQKYFFHDNPTWNINYSGYLFQSLIGIGKNWN